MHVNYVLYVPTYPPDEDDLHQVKTEVVDVIKWFDVGLALGLKESRLKKIEIENRSNVDDCMMDMVSAWLRCDRADNAVENGRPSWRTLALALSKTDHHTIARTIADKYRNSQDPCTSSVQHSYLSPV